MRKEYQIILIILIVVMIGFAFYWYDLRPREQRKNCWNNAVNFSETALELEFDTCQDSSACRERVRFQYEHCLHTNHGLTD